MITQKKESKPPEFWGQAKGYIRHIQIFKHYAVYAVEESPGYRTVRYNKRRYNIFCPWIYFFIKVHANLEYSNTECLYAFFSKKRLETLDQKGLLIAPFSNSHEGGGICMPHFDPSSKSPIELALECIWQFWSSNGKEYGMAIFQGLPMELKEKVSSERPGGIFSRWAKMIPKQAINLAF